MDSEKGVLKKYLLWSKERFPAIGVILYSGSIFYLSYFFGNLFNNRPPVAFPETMAGFFVVFLVLLHIRIFDEHKDYDKDVIAYPERVLSKGIITLKDLRTLLYITVLIEFLISMYLGSTQAVVWLLILGWSLLMLYEFFVPEFLNEHMGLYLVSHQILLPIVMLFGFSMRYDLGLINSNDLKIIVLLMIGTMCATITYEIARKTWSEDREHEHADSYSKFWGIGKAVIINQTVAAASGCCFLMIYMRYNLSIVFTFVLAVLFTAFVITGVLFLKSPTHKNSKIVEAGGTLFLLGLFVNSIVAFCLYR